MPKITIYSTSICMYCQTAKQFFEENNIEYQEIDVSQDKSAAKEMIEKSDQMGVPVIVIGEGETEKVVIGFDKEKISQILGIKE